MVRWLNIIVIKHHNSYQSKFAMQMKRVSIRTATNMLKIIMVISCRRECLRVLGRTSLETTYFSLKLEELPSENVVSVRSKLQHLGLNWGPRLKMSKVQRLWCIFFRENNLSIMTAFIYFFDKYYTEKIQIYQKLDLLMSLTSNAQTTFFE